MASVWILHREARQRAALVRLADLGDEALAAAPSDTQLDSADPPRVVLLGLGSVLEEELEFVHRTTARWPELRWILVCEPTLRADAERLFDAPEIELLDWPLRRDLLRARLVAARAARSEEPLSERRRRDSLAERFMLFFRDLDLPDLLLALDPRRSNVPLLIRGESGSGRSLLARYVHSAGVRSGEPLVFVSAEDVTTRADLSSALLASRCGDSATLCVEDADRLSPALQRELVRWIELGAPGLLAGLHLRFMASVDDDEADAIAPGLLPALAQALAGVSVRIPPLRERAAAIPRLASAIGRARGTELAPDALDRLQAHAWPGNLRELEAVVSRSLANASRSPLPAEDLCFEAESGQSLPASNESPPVESALSAADAEPAAETEPAARTEPEADPEPPEEKVGEPVASARPDAESLRRLAGALAHEIGVPLATIRSLTEQLPEGAGDPQLRDRAGKHLPEEVSRIERALQRLVYFASCDSRELSPVDVTALLESALEERRGSIESRRLVVLKELERGHSMVMGVRKALGFALRLLIDHAFEQLPERGDLYIASRHHPSGPAGTPIHRILLRFDRNGRNTAERRADPPQTPLALLLVEQLIRAQGGSLTTDGSDGEERVIVADLQAS